MSRAPAERALTAFFGALPVRRRDVVLCLHGVSDDRPDGFAPAFEQQLGSDEFRFLIDELRATHDIVPPGALMTERIGDRPRAALTFDDGYRNNLTVVLPLLEELDASAAVFVITGYVGTDRTFWWDALGRWLDAARDEVEITGLGAFSLASEAGRRALFRRFYWSYLELDPEATEELLGRVAEALDAPAPEPSDVLSPEDVRRLAESGRVEIGSHLVEHAPAARLGTDELRRQLQASKRNLEAWTGRPVRFFAWPNGQSADIPADGPRLVQEAGYELALTTVPGWIGPAGARITAPFMVERLSIARGVSRRTLAAKLAGMDVVIDRLWRRLRSSPR